MSKYYFERGRCLQLLERIEEARADLLKVAEMNPQNSDAVGMLNRLISVPTEFIEPFPQQKTLKSNAKALKSHHLLDEGTLIVKVEKRKNIKKLC